MPRAHKSCKRFARRCDEILLERDALITRLHRISRTDLAIPASNLIPNSSNLITLMLSLGEVTAPLTKRLQKERFDVVRLQPASLRSFHLLPYLLHTGCIHRISCKSVVFHQ